jgi:type III restriction enzyme
MASRTNRILLVETRSQKLIVKIKAANGMDHPMVQAKTRAATKWVERANAHAQENGGKPWAYVLVPHDVVLPSATLKVLLARHVLGCPTAYRRRRRRVLPLPRRTRQEL